MARSEETESNVLEREESKEREPQTARIDVEAGDDEESIEIYVEYEALLVGDFTEMLNHISRAYDALRIERLPKSELRGDPPRRERFVRIAAPLRVERVETGKSIILILVGGATVIVALGKIAGTAFGVGAAYEKWRAAKTEREAAELYRDSVKKLANPPTVHQAEQKAENELLAMQRSVESNRQIKKFRIQFDKVFTWEYPSDTK